MWPAVTTYNGRGGTTVGTPAIDSNLARDIYVTFDAAGGNGTTSGAQVQNDLPAGSVVLGVTIEPLLAWLWLGGLIIGAGSALTSFGVDTATKGDREALDHDLLARRDRRGARPVALSRDPQAGDGRQ